MKWMQVLSSKGAELDLVRSYNSLVSATAFSWNMWMEQTLTSTFDMLPTTFDWLSTTARDVNPSLFINLRASLRGLSPLWYVNLPHTSTKADRDILD